MRYATYSRLMALPLLPAEHIQPAFNNLRDSLPDDVDECMTALVTTGSEAGCGHLARGVLFSRPFEQTTTWKGGTTS